MVRRVEDHKRRAPDLSVEFDSDAGAPRKARTAIGELISRDDDPLSAEVETVTSELVSNVVQHTDGGGTMDAWEPKPDVPIRIEVTDHGDGRPEPALHTDPTEVGGQGLRIVEEMADAWGVEYRPGGKKVWVEFDRDARSNPSRDGA